MYKKFKFSLFILITLLFSCHSDLFIHRRYSSGCYREILSNKGTRQLKNENPLITEQTFSEIKPEKPIHKLVSLNYLNSGYLKDLLVKDSIINSRKRGGKHIRQVFKNNNDYDILVIKREGRKDIVRKEKSERAKLITSYKPLVLISLIISIIPVFGLILTLHSRHNRKELLKLGEDKIVAESKTQLTIASVIAITVNILLAMLLLFLIFLLIFAVVTL